MAMRDPKLREQLETHYTYSNGLAKRGVERNNAAARMAAALRDEDSTPGTALGRPTISLPNLYARSMAPRHRYDHLVDAAMYAVLSGTAVRFPAGALSVTLS